MSFKIKRALISLSDKTNIINFSKILITNDCEIISTGGTYKYLLQNDIKATEVSEITGFPEIMDGRVKTLHPNIHAGILQRRNNEDDQQQLSSNKISAFDLLIVNLYPFIEALKNTDDENKLIEKIDIGGPAMIRAAAKNFANICVINDPNDYDEIANHLTKNNFSIDLSLRKKLAAKAFSHSANYDSAIANWFNHKQNNFFPNSFSLSGTKVNNLRYGENPHQKAAIYRTHSDNNKNTLINAKQIQGKELSYNNMLDADAAFKLISSLPSPLAACAIIKHNNPCGCAIDRNLTTAYLKALSTDNTSAFGSIVAINRELDAQTAQEISKIFTELIICPAISDDAKTIMAKKKNLRILTTEKMLQRTSHEINLRQISGGFLLQQADLKIIGEKDLNIVTKKQPNPQQISDMILAFTICKFVKSNAVIYVKDGQTAAIGAGQMSRLDSAFIATSKAKNIATTRQSESLTVDSSVASDAFFPFADGLLEVIKAGATSVIQPGGSIRDKEVIKAADEAGITMAFTSIRHFLH